MQVAATPQAVMPPTFDAVPKVQHTLIMDNYLYNMHM